MADKKISQLTAATTPLAGTEVVPIVQGGSTVKVPVSDLTAGRAVSVLSATLSGGTANGVVYLNASKVATSGSALVFNGTNLGIGTTLPIADSGLTIGNDGNGNATVKLAFSTSATERGSVQLTGANGEMRLTAGYAGYGGLMTFHANGSERARITADGNIVAGASAALATTATNGFLYVPTCAGTPTGTPTAITGMAPIVVDTTNNKLYFYSGGQWRDAGP
jgi:hypothetical protein